MVEFGLLLILLGPKQCTLLCQQGIFSRNWIFDAAEGSFNGLSDAVTMVKFSSRAINWSTEAQKSFKIVGAGV